MPFIIFRSAVEAHHERMRSMHSEVDTSSCVVEVNERPHDTCDTRPARDDTTIVHQTTASATHDSLSARSSPPGRLVVLDQTLARDEQRVEVSIALGVCLSETEARRCEDRPGASCVERSSVWHRRSSSRGSRFLRRKSTTEAITPAPKPIPPLTIAFERQRSHCSLVSIAHDWHLLYVPYR